MKGWLGVAAIVGLAGCATPDTALQLVREQQQIQRAAQDHEARNRSQAVAGEEVVQLSTIRQLQTEGRHFAALAHLDAFQNQFGESPDVALLRADALRATGQGGQSEAAYRALLNGPQAAQAWHGLGLLAGARSDFGAATQALSKAAALAPTDVGILGDLGFARLSAGDRRGARVPLAQAAELAPDHPKTVANLALLMATDGNAEGAEAVMQRAGLSEAARDAVRRQAATLAALPAPVVAAPPVPATATQATASQSSRADTLQVGRSHDVASQQTPQAASPHAVASESVAANARPIVRAVPAGGSAAASASTDTMSGSAAAGAPARVSTAPSDAFSSERSSTVGSADSPAAVPVATNAGSASSPLDLYAAPTQSLFDRFAASGTHVQ